MKVLGQLRRAPLRLSSNQNGAERPFVFVVPVRNPKDAKVRDYRTIEGMLQNTVRSLLRQTHLNVRVVVVSHGVPRSAPIDPRVFYLDVSRAAVFGPDANSLQIDKGLRYVIGAAFAIVEFKAELLMPMDADDYVNTRLADLATSDWRRGRDIDGFFIDSGLNVQVRIGRRRQIGYEKAIIVDQFNKTCGSCRIFSADRLRLRLLQIAPDLLDRFAKCQRQRNGAFRVSSRAARWLYRLTLNEAGDPGPAYELVHALGRHIKQGRVFRLLPLGVLGAAKGCGHGNHEGPHAGGLHAHKAVGTLSIPAFRRMFGLDE